MKHYHGLTLDDILHPPREVLAALRRAGQSDNLLAEGYGCFRIEETPLGDWKRYVCKPGPEGRRKPPTTRKAPRCVCGRVAKHCQRRMGSTCQCGAPGGACPGAR